MKNAYHLENAQRKRGKRKGEGTQETIKKTYMKFHSKGLTKAFADPKYSLKSLEPLIYILKMLSFIKRKVEGALLFTSKFMMI